MPRRSKPGERRGGRQQGTPNKPIVSKAASVLAAAGKIAKRPSFSAYIGLFELAEDYDRDLTVALAKKPQNPTEIVDAGSGSLVPSRICSTGRSLWASCRESAGRSVNYSHSQSDKISRSFRSP